MCKNLTPPPPRAPTPNKICVTQNFCNVGNIAACLKELKMQHHPTKKPLGNVFEELLWSFGATHPTIFEPSDYEYLVVTPDDYQAVAGQTESERLQAEADLLSSAQPADSRDAAETQVLLQEWTLAPPDPDFDWAAEFD